MNRKNIGFLIIWLIALTLGMVLFTFLHECGHGFGAQLDGLHLSTGFNEVGDYGKTSDDPNSRSGNAWKAVWSGLLGPITTWLLAITFTVWLFRFKEPSWGH